MMIPILQAVLEQIGGDTGLQVRMSLGSCELNSYSPTEHDAVERGVLRQYRGDRNTDRHRAQPRHGGVPLRLPAAAHQLPVLDGVLNTAGLSHSMAKVKN